MSALHLDGLPWFTASHPILPSSHLSDIFDTCSRVCYSIPKVDTERLFFNPQKVHGHFGAIKIYQSAIKIYQSAIQNPSTCSSPHIFRCLQRCLKNCLPNDLEKNIVRFSSRRFGFTPTDYMKIANGDLKYVYIYMSSPHF